MTLIDADKLIENLIEAYVKNHFNMTLKEIIDIVYKMKDESTNVVGLCKISG